MGGGGGFAGVGLLESLTEVSMVRAMITAKGFVICCLGGGCSVLFQVLIVVGAYKFAERMRLMVSEQFSCR